MRKAGRGWASDDKSVEAADRIEEELMHSFAKRNEVSLASTRALFTVFGESENAAKRIRTTGRGRNARGD